MDRRAETVIDVTDDYNTATLAARWTAVTNDEVGGWAVSADGRTPLNGGRMAADMVMTQELAEHIAATHNQWMALHHSPVTETSTTEEMPCFSRRS